VPHWCSNFWRSSEKIEAICRAGQQKRVIVILSEAKNLSSI
jgi:hypothetical protein